MNYAIIDTNNLVINMVVWDGNPPWSPPEGCIAVLAIGDASIGWSYVDGEFIPPAPQPEPAPEP